jgi:hypothetical protein
MALMIVLMSVLVIIPLGNQIGFSSVAYPDPNPDIQRPCLVSGEPMLPNQTVIMQSNENSYQATKADCQADVDENVEYYGFRVINTSEVSGCECFQWTLKN